MAYVWSRRSAHRNALVPLLVVVVGGCSASTEIGTTAGTDGGAGDAGHATIEAPRTYDEYVRAFARATCEAIFECDPHDDWTAPAYFGTVERCEASAPELLGTMSLNDHLEAAVQSGTLTFRPAEAARCLAAITGCAVVGPTRSVAGCLEVLEGTIPDGGPCSVDEECAGDAYCGSPNGDCPGTCRVRAKENGQCLDARGCSPGDGSAIARCTLNVPQPPMPATGVCHVFEMRHGALLGEPCGDVGSEDVDCARGLYCDRSGHCATPVPAGGSCASGERCGPGVECDGSTCVALVVQTSVGGTCGTSTTSCNALDDLVCTSGSCKKVGTGAAGSACTDIGTTCQIGFFCDTSSGTARCAAQKGAGVACTRDKECQSGACSIAGSCTQSFCSVELAR